MQRSQQIPHWRLLLIGLCCAVAFVALPGCSRTVIGGYLDSPDGVYRLFGRVYGAYGRAFLESHTKTVRITIVAVAAQGAPLFKEEYRIPGYDVGWDATWVTPTNVRVVIYDYGPGVSHWETEGSAAPTNHLRTINFSLDARAGRFVETKPRR